MRLQLELDSIQIIQTKLTKMHTYFSQISKDSLKYTFLEFVMAMDSLADLLARMSRYLYLLLSNNYMANLNFKKIKMTLVSTSQTDQFAISEESSGKVFFKLTQI